MILLIDYREKGFINEIEKMEMYDIEQNIYFLKIDKDTNIYYKITNLDIGDFLICNYETNNENKPLLDTKYIYENLILLIERKTFNDLSSSIIDGRFREQKSRIEQTINDNNKIMYIIEGIRKKKEKHGIKINILEGAILNMIFKHKFKILNTNDINDTYETITTICKKFKKHEYIMQKNEIINETEKEIDNNSITEVNFTNLKKSDRTFNNIFNLQLSVIPGVSINIAKKISEDYKCMMDLINAYNLQENNLKKENLLADIQITEKRKLGKALSKKIYNAIKLEL